MVWNCTVLSIVPEFKTRIGTSMAMITCGQYLRCSTTPGKRSSFWYNTHILVDQTSDCCDSGLVAYSGTIPPPPSCPLPGMETGSCFEAQSRTRSQDSCYRIQRGMFRLTHGQAPDRCFRPGFSDDEHELKAYEGLSFRSPSGTEEANSNIEYT